MKVASIVGARPQFIKAALISKELRKKHTEILVHTGQHYDREMSDVFFEMLGIPEPDYNLGIGSGEPGEQTGRMVEAIEKVLLKEKPDVVIVYGDTNSTLAGALAASKLNIPVAHVEAGLRSFNREMPEEINRVLTDHISTIFFCPTQTAVKNLRNEGIRKGVYLVGDVMFDVTLAMKPKVLKSKILAELGLERKKYILATVHRQGNTDSRKNLASILDAFIRSGKTIVFPVHPRTGKILKRYGLYKKATKARNLRIIPPVDYLDFQSLLINAEKVLTDSGGVQKEAYFAKVPCITLREETEWVETVRGGWNVLVGVDGRKFQRAIHSFRPETKQRAIFGNGQSYKHIITILSNLNHSDEK
jgi:UDP-N-acetylglucosamine 2-epimerase (non-hydrolysing)